MIDNLSRAEQVTEGSLGKRARAIMIERRNDAVKQAVQVAVGDYVRIKRPPAPGRPVSLDERLSGPCQWKVVCQNGDSGLSFQCQLMGSRVRYTTAHVENMKPFHQRPKELQPEYEGIKTDLSSAEVQEVPHDERLTRLLDRRVEPDGTWAYKWLRCDGTELWAREAELVDAMQMPSWVLDTFHALYEIEHLRDMCESAKRPTPQKDARLKREEALRQYPKGTKVARAVVLKNKTEYIFGQVRDFVRPRWRVRYEDDEWEDLSSSQMRQATLMAL
jgi:hypothetical protein